MTLRLALCDGDGFGGAVGSAIGISFDHALCDVSGAALGLRLGHVLRDLAAHGVQVRGMRGMIGVS